jgi:hypothetical protein
MKVNTSMTPNQIKQFVNLASGKPINAYTAEGEKRKNQFHRLGASLLQDIACALKLHPTTYEVRWNPGGIAVCGDVTLHGENIYINFSQSCLGPDWGFMYRSCKGCKDYVGGHNQWMKWDKLLNLPLAIASFRGIIDSNCIQVTA